MGASGAQPEMSGLRATVGRELQDLDPVALLELDLPMHSSLFRRQGDGDGLRGAGNRIHGEGVLPQSAGFSEDRAAFVYRSAVHRPPAVSVIALGDGRAALGVGHVDLDATVLRLHAPQEIEGLERGKVFDLELG